jgi:hypothetical protein
MMCESIFEYFHVKHISRYKKAFYVFSGFCERFSGFVYQPVADTSNVLHNLKGEDKRESERD